jgi:hypothetical protein
MDRDFAVFAAFYRLGWVLSRDTSATGSYIFNLDRLFRYIHELECMGHNAIGFVYIAEVPFVTVELQR